MKYASFGSVSSGTMRTEDLLQSFAENKVTGEKLLAPLATANKPASSAGCGYCGAARGDYCGMAPAKVYRGGVCPKAAPKPAGGDPRRRRENYRGEVLHVNDHGNVTLYVADASEHEPLDKFTCDYLDCAEWLLDEGIDRDLIRGWSIAAMEQARSDCADFQEDNADNLAIYTEQTGYAGGNDFWLTRNKHGAGFWDRGLGEVGNALSSAAKVYGSCGAYLGDDGYLYLS